MVDFFEDASETGAAISDKLATLSNRKKKKKETPGYGDPGASAQTETCVQFTGQHEFQSTATASKSQLQNKTAEKEYCPIKSTEKVISECNWQGPAKSRNRSNRTFVFSSTNMACTDLVADINTTYCCTMPSTSTPSGHPYVVPSTGKETPIKKDEAGAFSHIRKALEDRGISNETLQDKQQNDKTEKRRLDFLDILLTAREEHGLGLSAQEIQDEVDTFTFEGHDTTSSAISWTIFALAKHPVLQEKVFSEVRNIIGGKNSLSSEQLGKFTYLPTFIKEVLRYYSPVPMIARRHTDTPIVLDSIDIPVGVSIWVQIYCIHHNKDVWPNHEVFDPERFSANQRDETDIYGFIPFSAGSRNCIGQVFAMNEIKITIAKLVNRFEFLVDPENEPVLLPDIIMRSQNGVHVKLIERKH
ncbi:cytochrome P450 4B1-like [Ruditapes philippinarum]|uniref:cytochrome P450 4B1-like n=1 Tax=Ruditapes philippinarum TaxID=129788 RepID=UPI00295C17BF|nr:cytochrome P450 4B1-like [Ruditapes philippinarum]